MCTVNKSVHTKKVWKLIECTSYVVVKAVNFILFRGLNHRQCRQLLLQTEICMEISFISTMYVGLVEAKCYKECIY